MWYAEISKHLCNNGIKHTDESVKEMMKHTFLGYELTEMVNAVTGDTEQIRTLKKTSKLDTGEMFFYMEQVERWAVDIGCFVTIPKESQYMKIKEQQER